jgi:hypothetical protein
MNKKWYLGLSFCLLLACAPQPRARVNLPIHALQSRRAAAEKTARQFVTGFYSKNQEQLLALSAYPFYMDEGGLLNYPQEWQESLGTLFALQQSLPFELTTVRLLTPAEVPGFHMPIWNRLVELKYHQKVYALVETRLTTPRGPVSERVFLILDFLPESEEWRVKGFIS